MLTLGIRHCCFFALEQPHVKQDVWVLGCEDVQSHCSLVIFVNLLRLGLVKDYLLQRLTAVFLVIAHQLAVCCWILKGSNDGSEGLEHAILREESSGCLHVGWNVAVAFEESVACVEGSTDQVMACLRCLLNEKGRCNQCGACEDNHHQYPERQKSKFGGQQERRIS